MKFLTFDQIKAQLRLDDEQAELERDLLTLYGESAEDAVLSLIRRNISNLTEKYGQVPKQIRQASLMLVALWYEHREPVTNLNVTAVPYAFDLLIKSYVRLDGAEMPVDPVAYYLTDFYGRRIVTSDDCYIVVMRKFD
ncbi:MAG: head-tail connector protein [Prevotella sp.]|nr:head-tail connector protein [Prevotella sp.]